MSMDELKEYAKSLFAQLPPEAILEILSETVNKIFDGGK